MKNQKSKKKNLASLILDIERTRLELTACKQSIRNSDKEIEELKNDLLRNKFSEAEIKVIFKHLVFGQSKNDLFSSFWIASFSA